MHPHNLVRACARACVCVGRCREESIPKFPEMLAFRWVIRLVACSNPGISAEHLTQVPSLQLPLWPAALCCHFLGQLSVKVVWEGGFPYSSSLISLLQRSERAVSFGGEFANPLPAQEWMYINIIKCLISEAAVFC